MSKNTLRTEAKGFCDYAEICPFISRRNCRYCLKVERNSEYGVTFSSETEKAVL